MISAENISNKSIFVNSCGIEHHSERAEHTIRPSGRIDYHILHIASGECFVKFDEQSEFISAKAGSVILFRPMERQEYMYKSDTDTVSYYIHFTGKDCKQILEELEIYDLRIFNVEDSISFKQTIRPMVEEFSFNKIENDYFCAGLLLQLLSIISRKYRMTRLNIESENEKQIASIARKIYSHEGVGLSVEELAKECCLSVGHFSHLFKKIMGYPPHTYMIVIRMAKARDLLMSTQLSVREIAEAIGCPDQNYFSRMFKKYIGMSPSQIRKNL